MFPRRVSIQINAPQLLAAQKHTTDVLDFN